MRTNLDRTITSTGEAKAFLSDLIRNDEVYHPEDDAHDIIWETTTVTPEECDKLNSLMEQVYEFFSEDFDPCGYIIDNGNF